MGASSRSGVQEEALCGFCASVGRVPDEPARERCGAGAGHRCGLEKSLHASVSPGNSGSRRARPTQQLSLLKLHDSPLLQRPSSRAQTLNLKPYHPFVLLTSSPMQDDGANIHPPHTLAPSDPALSTLNPQPSTLSPQPSTLNPQSQTLNPTQTL